MRKDHHGAGKRLPPEPWRPFPHPGVMVATGGRGASGGGSRHAVGQRRGEPALTPTARTLVYLRRQGYLTAVVESWIPHANLRRDLWGFGDVLAVHPRDRLFLLVQVTTTAHVAHRLAKAKSRPPSFLLPIDGRIVVQILPRNHRSGPVASPASVGLEFSGRGRQPTLQKRREQRGLVIERHRSQIQAIRGKGNRVQRWFEADF